MIYSQGMTGEDDVEFPTHEALAAWIGEGAPGIRAGVRYVVKPAHGEAPPTHRQVVRNVDHEKGVIDIDVEPI